MRIAVCEDDEIQASLLEKLLIDRLSKDEFYNRTENVIDIYYSVESIENGIVHNRYDIFFLDIEIGSDNGINLAHTIRQFDKNTIIIFTTSHSECVFDVFGVRPLDFITKPSTEEKVDKVLVEIVQALDTDAEIFTFVSNRENISLHYSDIIYVYSTKRAITLITAREEYVFNGTIKSVYDRLPHYMFGKTGSSGIVNYMYIYKMSTDGIICRISKLGRNINVEVSRRAYKELSYNYSQYIASIRGRLNKLW